MEREIHHLREIKNLLISRNEKKTSVLREIKNPLIGGKGK